MVCHMKRKRWYKLAVPDTVTFLACATLVVLLVFLNLAIQWRKP